MPSTRNSKKRMPTKLESPRKKQKVSESCFVVLEKSPIQSFWERKVIKFPFKRKACQVYRVKYGRGRIW